MTVCDLTGKPIEPGSVIAWPNRRGANMWMNVGVVQGIYEECDWIHGPRTVLEVWIKVSGGQDLGTTRISKTENVVVVEEVANG